MKPVRNSPRRVPWLRHQPEAEPDKSGYYKPSTCHASSKLALRGAELILLSYNTPTHIPEHPELDHLVGFHHQLCLQSGAYQNGCWVVAVAKAGTEEGVSQLGLTSIVSPVGQVVAQTTTPGDELIVHDCDLDASRAFREDLLNFAENRKIEHYSIITQQTDVRPPD